MNSQSKYYNELGDEIRIESQCFPNINTVLEDYFENEILVRRKTLENGQLIAEHYYAFSITQVQKLVEENQAISIIYRRWMNDCKVDEYLEYIDKALSAKRVSVENKNGEPICFRHTLFQNGEITLESTEKRFFEDGKEKYQFDYNPDGTCFMINKPDSFQDIFARDIETGETDFTWEGFEYYKYAEPLLPQDCT